MNGTQCSGSPPLLRWQLTFGRGLCWQNLMQLSQLVQMELSHTTLPSGHDSVSWAWLDACLAGDAHRVSEPAVGEESSKLLQKPRSASWAIYQARSGMMRQEQHTRLELSPPVSVAVKGSRLCSSSRRSCEPCAAKAVKQAGPRSGVLEDNVAGLELLQSRALIRKPARDQVTRIERDTCHRWRMRLRQHSVWVALSAPVGKMSETPLLKKGACELWRM